MNNEQTSKRLNPEVRIGHIHLKVADLERSIKFYTQVLGFDITTRMGKQAAFLSAGGYHHHIGLNTWESAGGSPPPAGSTGLFHFAILMPNRMELARALRRLLDHKYPIDGTADHGVSEAIYLRDPDDNGIELYFDRPRDQWPQDHDGRISMYTRPLDIDSLLMTLTVQE
jgi:catechol 2,3-dioxygenase